MVFCLFSGDILHWHTLLENNLVNLGRSYIYVYITSGKLDLRKYWGTWTSCMNKDLECWKQPEEPVSVLVKNQATTHEPRFESQVQCPLSGGPRANHAPALRLSSLPAWQDPVRIKWHTPHEALVPEKFNCQQMIALFFFLILWENAYNVYYVNYFEESKSVSFSTFIVLCNHHHYF